VLASAANAKPAGRVTAAVIAGVALLAAMGLTACGSSGSGTSRLPSARSAPLLSIFEAEAPLYGDPPGTLATLRALGADTVRVYVPWRGSGFAPMAPDPSAARPPAHFDGANPAAYPEASWSSLDTIIRDAARAGLHVDLTIGGRPPLWARGPGDPGHPAHPQWRPNVTAFGAWVRALGRRYSGHYRDPATGATAPRVDFWAIWNEPNFGPEIAPQAPHGIAVSPGIYRNLLDAAWQSLAATGHTHDTILIGELAPYGEAVTGPGSFGYMVPLRFLRALYCVSGSLQPLRGAAATAVGCPASSTPAGFRAAHPLLFDATGLALHPYTQGPPTVSLPGEPDYANLAALPRVEHTVDGIFSAYGVSRRLPLYATEFGVHTNPPETVYGTVSPEQAAMYLNEAEYLSWRDPQVRSYSQYLLADGPTGVFATGLESSNGRPKPGFDAYRMPLYLPITRLHGGQPLEVWGSARPARYAPASERQVELQLRAAGAAAFRTIRTVALPAGSVYFDLLQRFGSAGSVRVAWKAPGGQTFFSRTVQLTTH
jgi:hypothetical protein